MKDERKSLDKRHWIYTPIPLDALSIAYTLSIWAFWATENKRYILPSLELYAGIAVSSLSTYPRLGICKELRERDSMV